MNEKIIGLYDFMAKNEEAAERLSKVTSPAEAISILAEYGFEITEDELKEVVLTATSDELPVELLDLVAGGGKIADFFWGFCDGIKGYWDDVKGWVSKILK